MDNSIKTVAHNNMLQVWTERVQECRGSGVPVRHWCKDHGIKVSTFYAWQKKVFNAVSTEIRANTNVAAPVFAELPGSLPASNDIVAILKADGLSVELYDNASAEFIENIIRGLRSC